MMEDAVCCWCGCRVEGELEWEERPARGLGGV